jgi:hypothetical protein
MIERLIFTMFFSAVLAVIATANGLGWFNEMGLNIVGSFLNIIGVIFIVIISNLIWR